MTAESEAFLYIMRPATEGKERIAKVDKQLFDKSVLSMYH